MPTESPPLIEVRNVSKRFRYHREGRSFQQSFINWLWRRRRAPQRAEEAFFWPLRDISFSVQRGDSLGIIGHNGSGKSTLLKLLTGILEPTAGEIQVRGRVSSLLELGAGFHPDLTGRENIYLNGSMYGLSRAQMRERIDSIIDFAELHEFIDTPVKHYSSGMYVRLGFAVAIHSDPDLLLVDEVLAVGDAAFQYKCLDAVQSFRQAGGTLVLVTHDLSSIRTICNRALWLEKGEIQAAGAPLDVTLAYIHRVAERDQGQEQSPLPELQSGERWGSGHAQITAVELCGASGQPQTVFHNGECMEIRLRYRRAPQIEPPVLGLAIHDQNGIHICGPNTDFGQLSLPAEPSAGEVSYHIPALPLLPGTYIVTVAAVDRATQETYDYHDRAYSFRVYPGVSLEQYGLVTLNGEWRWNGNGAASPAPTHLSSLAAD